MQFVSLHSHSTFSAGDGFGMPADHVARVADLGMGALALSEHGNVSSHVKLEQAAKAAGIKPIFGLEAYVAPKNMRERKYQSKWHMIILAMNAIGYQNLMQLVALSWDEGYFYRPTIHWEWLEEHNEGLIVTSGCLDGVVNVQLLGRKGLKPSSGLAIRRIRDFQRVFGDRFYLEAQRFPQLRDTRLANTWAAEAAHRFGIGLVATADVHYPLPEQNEMQKILHAANRGMKSIAEAEAAWEYDVLMTYPRSDKELHDALRGTGLSTFFAIQAVKNTAEIADRCNVELPSMARVKYPFAEDGAESPQRLIRDWLNEGWILRGFDGLDPIQRSAAHERVLRELDVFEQKDFIHYFLMIADAVRYAKREGIAVGPGRGSAAASLCMYLLQVTEINPLTFPMMMLERFVDPDRMDLPDVDIDFEPDRKDEIRQYLVSKYGADRVGSVGTYTMYRGKNSVNDVARVHQVPFMVAQKIKDMTPDEGFAVALAAFPVVADLVKEHPALNYAVQLEGNVKGFGQHPAGLVVGAEPLTKYVATYTRDSGTGLKKKRVKVLSVDKYDGEALGLLKIDALGLTTMGEIRLMASTVGMSMDDVYSIPLDDDAVLAGFREGRTGGIFQFTGSTTRDICVEVAPREFMDLAHINALSRPGPLHGGSTGEFIKARQGRSTRERMHPLIEDVLSMTEGEIVYQEQVIQLAAKVGGFDVAGAARVRKIISKKEGQAAFTDLWKDFAEGALKNGVPAEQAQRVWKGMITSGGYAFNVAHAVSYSVLAYWTMWFRIHHPLAFFHARLVHAADKDGEATLDILKDMAASTKIKVMPLDSMFSGANWRIDGNAVRPGLRQVPGIGATVAAKLVEYRKEWSSKYRWDLIEWEDFLDIKGLGPKAIEKLTTFARDEDPFGVQRLFDMTANIRGWISTRHLPQVTKTSDMIPYIEGRWSGVLLGVVLEVKHRDLYETHRNRTGEELSRDDVKEPDLATSAELYCEDIRGKYKIKINRFKFPELKDQIEAITTDEDFVLAEVNKSARFPGKTTWVDRMWVIEK